MYPGWESPKVAYSHEYPYYEKQQVLVDAEVKKIINSFGNDEISKEKELNRIRQYVDFSL